MSKQPWQDDDARLLANMWWAGAIAGSVIALAYAAVQIWGHQ